MRHPLDPKGPQVCNRKFRSSIIEIPSGTHPAPRRHNFDVDQVRSSEALALQPGPDSITVVSVISEGRDDDAGVDDDHRVSR